MDSLLAPITDLNRQAASECLAPDATRALLTAVVEAVATQFGQEARTLLDSVNKMEESLKRLKRAREQKGGTAATASTPAAAGASAAAGVTDNDKIKVQLYVDVCYFARKLRNEIYLDDNAVLPETVISLEQAVASAAATLVPEVSTRAS